MKSPLFYTLGISPTLLSSNSGSVYKIQTRDKNFAFKKKKNHEFPSGSSIFYVTEKSEICYLQQQHKAE